MASRRRPRLQPVAAPTDPFERPGVEQPDAPLGGLNVAALAELSPTLFKFHEAQVRNANQAEVAASRKEEKSRQAARDAEETNVAKFVSTPQDRLTNIIRSKEEKEAYQALADAGAEGPAHPLNILKGRKAAVNETVRRLNYPDRLANLMKENAVKAFRTSREEANADIDALLEDTLEELGDLGEGVGRDAVVAQLQLYHTEFYSKREAQIRQVAEVDREILAGQSVQTTLDTVFESIFDERPGYAFVKSMDALSKHIDEDALANGGDKIKSIKNVMTALEAQLLATIPKEGEDVLDALDRFQEHFGHRELDDEFIEMEAKLRTAVGTQERYDRRKVPEAQRAAEKAATDALLDFFQGNKRLMTKEEALSWQAEKSDAIAEEIAEKYGVPADQLTGVISRVRESLSTDKSKSTDPDASKTYLDHLGNGRLEEAKSFVMEAIKDGSINTVDGRSYLSEIRAEQAREGNQRDNIAARRDGFSGWFSSQGALTPEAGVAESFLKNTYDDAYNAYLDENPGNRAGALQAAQTAAENHPRFKQVQEARTTIEQLRLATGESFRRETTAVSNLFKERRAARQSALINDGTQIYDTEARTKREKEIMGRWTAAYKQRANELLASAEIKELPSAVEQRAAVEAQLETETFSILERIEGTGDHATAETAKLNSDFQLERLQQRNINPMNIKAWTKIGDRESYWFNDTAMSEDLSWIEETLSDIVSGGLQGSVSLTTDNRWKFGVALQKSDDVMGAAAAYLKGHRGEPGGGGRMNSLLSGLRTRDEAIRISRTMHAFKGLTLQNIIDGKDAFGIPLADVWGRENVPWQAMMDPTVVPNFPSEKAVTDARLAFDAEEDKAKTPVGQALIKLGLDPEDSKVTDWYFESQEQLQKKRKTPYGGGANSRYFNSGVRSPKPDDPHWAKSVFKNARSKK